LAAYYTHILRAVQRIVVPRSLRLKLVPFVGLSRRCLRLDLPCSDHDISELLRQGIDNLVGFINLHPVE
jgi:hypothetical protein